MLIRLSYTTGTLYYPQFFRVLREIINDSTVTSIAALQTKATNESWTSSLLANLDTVNSYIVRTNSPDNTYTKAHISRASSASADSTMFEFVLQQKVYDNSNYYYTMVTTTTAGGVCAKSVSNGLTNPMSSSEWGPSVAPNGTAAVGTSLGVSGTTLSNNVTNTTGVTFSAGATFWAYVTDTCFMFSITSGYSVNGWPPYANPLNSALYGPVLFSQYQRRDHWNTSASTIIPVIADNGARTTAMFGQTTNDWGALLNPGSATTSECPFAIYNSVANTNPGTTSSWSVATNGTNGWAVAHGFGSRYSDVGALSTSVYTFNIPSQSLGWAIATPASTYAGYKMATSNLINVGYPMFPLTFRRMGQTGSVSTLGGNVTALSNVYMFNGDYLPGDEYVYNNKRYVLWPAGTYGPAGRLAYAIPKE